MGYRLRSAASSSRRASRVQGGIVRSTPMSDMVTRREALISLIMTGLALGLTCGRGSAQATSAAATLCPTGKLRAALIASNPVLVTRHADGTFGGVSVAVANALAGRLGVPIELKPYDNPARYNESLTTNDWDVGLAAR